MYIVKILHSSYNDIDSSINQETSKKDGLTESKESLFDEAYITLLNPKKK